MAEWALRTREALLLITCAACVGDAAPPSTVVTDSVGVRIATTDSSPWDGTRIYGQISSPTLELGADSPVPLHQVRSAQFLADGRILVSNGSTQQLIVFAPSGGFLTSIGQAGKGPGEFQSLAGIVVLPGDSILVYDTEARRASVFTSDGTLQRDFTPDLDDLDWDARASNILGRLGDAILFGAGIGVLQESSEGVYRPPLRVVTLDLQGSLLGELATVPGTTRFIGAGSRGFLPLAPVTSVVGNGDFAAVGPAAHAEVAVFDASSTLAALVRWNTPLRVIAEADLQEMIGGSLEAVPPPVRPDIQAMLESLPIPDSLPHYRSILLEETGRIWVARSEKPETLDSESPMPPERWAVFDPKGSWLGSVEVPEGYSILQVSELSVLALHRDDLGVETVTRHELMPSVDS